MRVAYASIVILMYLMGVIIGMNHRPYAVIITSASNLFHQFTIPCDTIHLETGMTYNTTIAQCDSNPYGTADGSTIDPIKLKNQQIHWVALSRDLIWCEDRQKLFSDTTHWRGPIPFGATIFIKSKQNPQINGHWVVHDCKAPRYKSSIDFLMDASNNVPKLGIATDIKIINYQLNKRVNKWMEIN